MLSRSFVLVSMLSMFSYVGISQTFDLPDTNLRNVLQTRYGFLMQGDKLVIATANMFAGNLVLSDAEITNASGLEYFTSIPTLDLQKNQLDSFPQLESLKQLSRILLNNNQLKKLPDLSSFLLLNDFQAYNNQLELLPFENGSASLVKLYCDNNNFQSFPSLDQFPSLEVLVMGYNQIDQEIDFSPLIQLKELHVHSSSLNKINGLEKLLNLEVLFAWGNNIQDFSGLDSNTTLKTFVVHKNRMYKLPLLMNKPQLGYVIINENRLTFEDIAQIQNHPFFGSYNYAPQNGAFSLPDMNVRVRDSIVISSTIDNESGNKYYWYKDGNLFYKGKILTLSNISISDAGKYELHIENNTYSGVVLKSNLFSVMVDSCLTVSGFSYELIDQDCARGNSIDLKISSVSSNFPVQYLLNHNEKIDTIQLGEIHSLESGKYLFGVRNSKGCEFWSETFSIDRIQKCDPVFSPDDDGLNDTFYIADTGMVEIFDLNRQLVKKFEAPAQWDGRNSNGDLVSSGYYVMIIDSGKVIHVTLMR